MTTRVSSAQSHQKPSLLSLPPEQEELLQNSWEKLRTSSFQEWKKEIKISWESTKNAEKTSSEEVKPQNSKTVVIVIIIARTFFYLITFCVPLYLRQRQHNDLLDRVENPDIGCNALELKGLLYTRALERLINRQTLPNSHLSIQEQFQLLRTCKTVQPLMNKQASAIELLSHKLTTQTQIDLETTRIFLAKKYLNRMGKKYSLDEELQRLLTTQIQPNTLHAIAIQEERKNTEELLWRSNPEDLLPTLTSQKGEVLSTLLKDSTFQDNVKKTLNKWLLQQTQTQTDPKETLTFEREVKDLCNNAYKNMKVQDGKREEKISEQTKFEDPIDSILQKETELLRTRFLQLEPQYIFFLYLAKRAKKKIEQLTLEKRKIEQFQENLSIIQDHSQPFANELREIFTKQLQQLQEKVLELQKQTDKEIQVDITHPIIAEDDLPLYNRACCIVLKKLCTQKKPFMSLIMWILQNMDKNNVPLPNNTPTTDVIKKLIDEEVVKEIPYTIAFTDQHEVPQFEMPMYEKQGQQSLEQFFKPFLLPPSRS